MQAKALGSGSLKFQQGVKMMVKALIQQVCLVLNFRQPSKTATVEVYRKTHSIRITVTNKCN